MFSNFTFSCKFLILPLREIDIMEYLERKLYADLIKWKKDWNGSVALMIEGMRRVGKSTIAERFGKENYDSYILIDFLDPKPGLIKIIKNNISNLDDFFANISKLYNVELHPRKSLIIFDEIQAVPGFRYNIKKFVKDGRFDYIETGSLLSIKRNKNHVQIPSEERIIKMYPMDFEEYLWATGDKTTIPFLKKHFEERKQLQEDIHRSVLLDFYRYLAIGGMPQAVLKYKETNSFTLCDQIKRDILSLYLQDIDQYTNYNTGDSIKEIYQGIPSQLMHHKTFVVSEVSKNLRPSRIGGRRKWLEDAMIANFSFRVADPNIDFLSSYENTKFRIYSADTGLMVTQIFMGEKKIDEDIYLRLILGKLNINDGMIIKNAVSQALVANGHSLFFTTFKDKSGNQYELDFLLSKELKIIPIEVKSTNRTSHASLDLFCEKFSQRLGNERYVLSPKNLKKEGRITFLPVYMSCFI